MSTHAQEIDAASTARPAECETMGHMDVPVALRENLELFLRLVHRVLDEYDPALRDIFDELLSHAFAANSPAAELAADARGFTEASELINNLPTERASMVARAFAAYFHLANICEENYRVDALRQRQRGNSGEPINDLAAAFSQLADECGQARAISLLSRLEFRPVFTAHPTEARRRAVEGKIRRIAALLDKRPLLHGPDLAENERCLLQEIDALLRTSPIGMQKPTPVQEASTVLDLFDSTLFSMVPEVYRRFDDWLLGERAGTVPPVCPAFFHPGSWIGSDRDGNPNVSARVSREVSELFRTHMLEALARETRRIGSNLTLDAESTPPSRELRNLWSHQLEMSEELSRRAEAISARELHRAAMLVMASRLEASIARTADLMYANCEEYLEDLRCIQQSLAAAGATRAAYGPLQQLIWQAESFGFHLVEMEFRQHSLVHARALKDLQAHEDDPNGLESELDPMTREVLDTFRAIGQIQRKNGVDAARRYIVSFTQSAQDIANVYELARRSFAHEADVPQIDVIPLFEQIEDLEHAVEILDAMLELPDVQRRLAQTNRKLEVMLGYSDSSKDAGPTAATITLHQAQLHIAEWAQNQGIDIVLMHGRGGAVGRGGGPANRAVLAQPKGSVNCCFKLTEQGEVIFARYGNPTLAQRHVESVAGATLLASAPSVEWTNTKTVDEFAQMGEVLATASATAFRTLIEREGFAEWFSSVTPLTEIGLMPLGSRPAKRGLGARSLEDLRAIPWIFSWSQARINLAAWYGLGSACEHVADLAELRRAYRQWPLFTTFIDNIEMSLAKTDERLAISYLSLGSREDLAHEVLEELRRTRRWVLKITENSWPLQHRRVLGPLVRMRLPFVNVLSLAQIQALRKLREQEELTPEERERLTYLILCTVSGVAAGLQNTG